MGDEWLVDEQIDVDIQKLQDFATSIREELETNFAPSLAAGIRPMLTEPIPTDPTWSESQLFVSRHDESRQAIGQLLGDVARGMAALSTAAMSISAEYLAGDAFSQATNQDVLRAFSGIEGQQTLDDYWQQEDSAENDPANVVPAELTDPEHYFGENSSGTSGPDGGTPALYQETVIAEGETGEYVIPADQEDMHDSRFDTPDYQA
ncbi:hypothetical protein O7632_01275 [Solwaraspora sp. WMMD406]|uniref:hypothetical protein n=1 Tax=Solwaraspora sp. WMMD406 TaxID=3016095 RepID=UPI00241645E7|nr:hypothetical protein [Solwaraspora sp. WMMD406]MDG4762754.1 hypothetical protein [Solwaraspora sp. WMMD406]